MDCKFRFDPRGNEETELLYKGAGFEQRSPLGKGVAVTPLSVLHDDEPFRVDSVSEMTSRFIGIREL